MQKKDNHKRHVATLSLRLKATQCREAIYALRCKRQTVLARHHRHQYTHSTSGSKQCSLY